MVAQRRVCQYWGAVVVPTHWSCGGHRLPVCRDVWLSAPVLTLSWVRWELRAPGDPGWVLGRR